MSLSLFSRLTQPEQQTQVISATVENCLPEKGGVGLELNLHNIILELRAGGAAEVSGQIQVGDRIVSVDGQSLAGKQLTEVMKPATKHVFEIERLDSGWEGLSIDDTNVAEKEEETDIDHFRQVTLQKCDGQVGIHPEVCFHEDGEILRIAKVYKDTRASASGVIQQGDRLVAINGVQLSSSAGPGSCLKQASDELAQVADGVDLTIDLESDLLMSGWMQKKGEKGLMKTWQKRFFTLIWSEMNLAEREIRYFDGQDYCTRKPKGAIDLTRCSAVNQATIDGGAAITLQTPGRLWELLPDSAAAAAEWYKLLTQLLSRSRGYEVVASMSNLALEQAYLDEEEGRENPAKPKQGELTVVLKRKLGMSINKMGQDIVVAQMDPDGAAAACGLLSSGDALLAVNSVEPQDCKAAIKLLTANTNAMELRLCTKVVHGGWMHKLGEGLGGWTTRYFTLAYELEMTSAQAHAVSTKSTRERSKSIADRQKTRQRATSVVGDLGGPAAFAVRLHKPTAADKLGLGLVEDEGGVLIEKIFPDYVAANSGSLMVGDRLVAVNGEAVNDVQHSLKVLLAASGAVELKIERKADPGSWVLRYYDGKNSKSRSEKGMIRLSKDTVREINKYTLQEEDTADGVPRVGLYILQEERCWELLPPEEELDTWVSNLQLAVFGQEVISLEYQSKEGIEAATEKVRALKGARTLTLQQQYGLVLATYEKSPPGALEGVEHVPNAVYIMNFEMDGAGACSGMLGVHDRVLEVDGVPAEDLKQVTASFKGSSNAVKVKVASKVVHGGFMLKKGQIAQEFQLRFFVLADEPDGSVLSYYEGCNVVTRKHKGDIKIGPKDVTSVRVFTHTNAQTGETSPGVKIECPGRTWEMLCKRANEARLWAGILNERVRPKRRAADVVHAEQTRARCASAVNRGAADASSEASSEPVWQPPQSTRL